MRELMASRCDVKMDVRSHVAERKYCSGSGRDHIGGEGCLLKVRISRLLLSALIYYAGGLHI